MPSGIARGTLSVATLALLLNLGMEQATAASVTTSQGPLPKACSAAVSRVSIASRVKPVVVSTDLSLEQIRAMAQRSAQRLRHPAYGFYLGRVFYSFAIHEEPPSPEGCPQRFLVTAKIALIDRRIEIASDLKDDACLFQKVLEHYRTHANADERAFKDFARTLPGKLELALRGTAVGQPKASGALRSSVQAAIDRLLAVLDKERAAAQLGADSPSEMANLSHPACFA